FGAVPFVFVRDFSRRSYDTLLGFGAGLMLAAATLALLPEALRSVRAGDAVDGARLATVLGGFGLGVAVLHLMDRLIPHQHARAAGALIYLTCNEIIPESHSHGNERRATFGVVAGFVVIVLMQIFLGAA